MDIEVFHSDLNGWTVRLQEEGDDPLLVSFAGPGDHGRAMEYAEFQRGRRAVQPAPRRYVQGWVFDRPAPANPTPPGQRVKTEPTYDWQFGGP